MLLAGSAGLLRRMLSRTEYEGLSPGDKPPVAPVANAKPPASARTGNGNAAKTGSGARADGKAGAAAKGAPQENGAAAPREKGAPRDGAVPAPRKASTSGPQKVGGPCARDCMTSHDQHWLSRHISVPPGLSKELPPISWGEPPAHLAGRR